MKKKILIATRWRRNYYCYNATKKHLKLSTKEIFIFRKAVQEGKIRFFREIPYVDDFEHRFFHIGDVRKVIDEFRTKKKERTEPTKKKIGKKKRTRLWIKNRQNRILEEMIKKQMVINNRTNV